MASMSNPWRPSRTGTFRQPGWRLTLALALAGLAPAVVLARLQDRYPPTPDMPGRIVYTRAQERIWDLYESAPNGAAEEKLTDTNDPLLNRTAAGEEQPRWSPDGEEVAFSTVNRNAAFTLWRVPWTGGTPTPLVTDTPGL